MLRHATFAAFYLYLGAGLFGGLLMERAIPAMNAVGVAFYATTWPMQIICARTTTECDPFGWVPMWAQSLMFTF